jgi:hypothetical protein
MITPQMIHDNRIKEMPRIRMNLRFIYHYLTGKPSCIHCKINIKAPGSKRKPLDAGDPAFICAGAYYNRFYFFRREQNNQSVKPLLKTVVSRLQKLLFNNRLAFEQLSCHHFLKSVL